MDYSFFVSGLFLRTLGEVMIGVTAIMVHRRFRLEHKIDNKVYSEMQREQVVGIIGVILLIVGFFVEII